MCIKTRILIIYRSAVSVQCKFSRHNLTMIRGIALGNPKRKMLYFYYFSDCCPVLYILLALGLYLVLVPELCCARNIKKCNNEKIPHLKDFKKSLTSLVKIRGSRKIVSILHKFK